MSRWRAPSASASAVRRIVICRIVVWPAVTGIGSSGSWSTANSDSAARKDVTAAAWCARTIRNVHGLSSEHFPRKATRMMAKSSRRLIHRLSDVQVTTTVRHRVWRRMMSPRASALISKSGGVPANVAFQTGCAYRASSAGSTGKHQPPAPRAALVESKNVGRCLAGARVFGGRHLIFTSVALIAA